jgi:hypothetical protein
MWIYEVNAERKPVDAVLCEFKQACVACEERLAEIYMWGYAENHAHVMLWPRCALQLARKLLEDLCAAEGDRRG